MKLLSLVSMILPDEILGSLGVLVVMVGGLSIVIGFRRFGAIAVLGGIGIILLPGLLPIIENLLAEVLSALPWWVGPLVLVAVGLVVLRLIGDVLLGRQASAHMVGTLAAGLVTFLLLLPFRGLAGLLRLLRGR